MLQKNNLKKYIKDNSFNQFKDKKKIELNQLYKKFIVILSNQNLLIDFSKEDREVIKSVQKDFEQNILPEQEKNETLFKIKANTYAEISTFNNNKDIIKYLIHRYRYEIYPKIKKLHIYPPLVQIEPSSICNFRCVFCFETDKSFTDKKNGFMGTMTIDVFKKIIDEIEEKVEFVTLASRGEPLVSNNIEKMLEYTSDKFLNLKINTNASLLNETKIHAILSSKVKTIVFSADAADSKLYKKLRVNGNLEKTLQNIKLFVDIKNKHYKNNKIITRVSGVKFNEEQKFEDMENLWSDIVDQVAFVNYNPWEDSYNKKSNNIVAPCSDLYRRIFVWWDGKVNPCDVDYKSHLNIGNISENTLKNLWNSEQYNELRNKHINSKRQTISPCNACSVV